ncbi:MAG: hypothetical protein AAGF12_30050 [Myxococcota bacterium]
MRKWILGICSLLAVSMGCSVGDRGNGSSEGGTNGDSGMMPPPSGLRIEPANETRTISGAPVVINYNAIFRNAAGQDADVTGDVTWTSTVPALGTMVGSQFQSTVDQGGATSIRATMGDLIAMTTLTLRMESVIITPGTPADAPTRFGGMPDPSRAPEIVYPADGTMVPPNVGELEFHYRPNGANLFELHIQAAALDVRIYFGCPETLSDGCAYTPDREAWETISTAVAGGGPFTYTLTGVNDAGQLGQASRTLTVAEEPITGGLYYWNAGGGTIDRFEFGVRGAVRETFLDQGRVGAATCVGCHALSRDGRRIAVGTDIPTTTLQVFDVTTRERVFSLGDGGGGLPGFPSQPNFYSFNPDATQLAASSLNGLSILDGTTGNAITTGLGGGPATMPDYAPNGQHIVYVRHQAPAIGFVSDVPGVTSGELHRLDWNGSAWTEGPELVSGGGNNFYPAYSPDGNWIVFNRSPSNTNSFGDDNGGGMGGVRDAELWAVSHDGGAPIELVAAGGLTDSWPKFDPTEYMDRDRPIFWFAWSSRRAFGLRYGDDSVVQLWMSAFDPSMGDPALPAFRLPFQDIGTGNHIAQWVTSIERMTCNTDVDCGGEFCVDGRCYEERPLL